MRLLSSIRAEKEATQEFVLKRFATAADLAHLLPEMKRVLGRVQRASEITRSMLGRRSRRINAKITMCLENGIPLIGFLETARLARALFDSHDLRVEFLRNTSIVERCVAITLPPNGVLKSAGCALSNLCHHNILLDQKFWLGIESNHLCDIATRYDQSLMDGEISGLLSFGDLPLAKHSLSLLASISKADNSQKFFHADSVVYSSSFAKSGCVIEHSSLGTLTLRLCKSGSEVRILGHLLANCLASDSRYFRQLACENHYLVGVHRAKEPIAAILFDCFGCIKEAGGPANQRVDPLLLLEVQREILKVLA